MKQYHDMLRHVLKTGVDKSDRTGTGTRSVFGHQMRFDLTQGFPLLATKFTPFKLVATELLWFLKGNPDISYLHENGCHIWDEWVREDGTFGPIYGQQWRSWPAGRYVGIGRKGNLLPENDIDQIANVIERLKTDPDNRRLIVSAWNVADVEGGEMALPPCHVLFQFYSAPMSEGQRIDWMFDNLSAEQIGDFWSTHPAAIPAALEERGVPKRKLSCQLYQRSADTFLGVPFNIASYSLLTHMIAHLTDHAVGDFIWTGGDVHIYHNHFDQAKELLRRDPDQPLPRLLLDASVTNIDAFNLSHMQVINYAPMAAIKAPVAV